MSWDQFESGSGFSEAGGAPLRMKEDRARSHSSFRSSRRVRMTSKRLISGDAIARVSGSLLLPSILNLPPLGFTAAKTVVLVSSVHTMPAFATLSVCCSIASWIAPRSASRIPSNSSMQHSPPSASTSAPASSTHSPEVWSLAAATVSPAEVVPMPVVRTPRGDKAAQYLRSTDFAVPGSPTMRRWDSPRTRVPESSWRGTPPMRDIIMMSLTRWRP
mmetsp:Transcript_12709/g.32172  ORF Transcript_12709/g.32172 Transcript_12709/m.32172 type:complete len:217 (-) Transcript_12709:220-870(-)